MDSSGVSSKRRVAVLISSAGRRVELINCFHQSARELDCDLTLIATDLRPGLSSACQRADKSFAVPRCDDPAFIPAILEICQRERVSLLVPTIDPELAPYAAARADFEKIGTTVAVSAPEIIALARNKLESNRFFHRIGLNAPRCALLQEVLQDHSSWQFPLIAKPINGSSSIGLSTVPSPDALRSLAVDPSRYVVQNLLRGPEYTVNLFFDRTGLRCATHHRRLEMRAGEVSKGITERLPTLSAAAETLGQALAGKTFGVLNFQAILDDSGVPQLLELNARFSGGYPLLHHAGAPFSKWLLEPLLGLPSTASNAWQPGLTMLRYDAAFFLPAPRQD